MTSTPGEYNKFLDFCEGNLTGSNKQLIGLITKRYNECSEKFRQSQELRHLLRSTRKKMSSDSKHLFVHLKDCLNELKAYSLGKGVKRKKPSEYDSDDNVVKKKKNDKDSENGSTSLKSRSLTASPVIIEENIDKEPAGERKQMSSELSEKLKISPESAIRKLNTASLTSIVQNLKGKQKKDIECDSGLEDIVIVMPTEESEDSHTKQREKSSTDSKQNKKQSTSCETTLETEIKTKCESQNDDIEKDESDDCIFIEDSSSPEDNRSGFVNKLTLKKCESSKLDSTTENTSENKERTISEKKEVKLSKDCEMLETDKSVNDRSASEHVRTGSSNHVNISVSASHNATNDEEKSYKPNNSQNDQIEFESVSKKEHEFKPLHTDSVKEPAPSSCEHGELKTSDMKATFEDLETKLSSKPDPESIIKKELKSEMHSQDQSIKMELSTSESKERDGQESKHSSAKKDREIDTETSVIVLDDFQPTFVNNKKLIKPRNPSESKTRDTDFDIESTSTTPMSGSIFSEMDQLSPEPSVIAVDDSQPSPKPLNESSKLEIISLDDSQTTPSNRISESPIEVKKGDSPASKANNPPSTSTRDFFENLSLVPSSSVVRKSELPRPSCSKSGIDESVDSAEDKKDKKKKEVSEKHIRKLEKLLGRLQKEIDQVQERELTLDDLIEEDSHYVYEDKLKKKFVAVWNKLCELKERAPTTGRPTERRFSYQGTRYPEINKKIEKFINRKKVFPDFHDIKRLVSKVNIRCKLRLNNPAVDSLAREAFTDVGNMLQHRRREDFVSTFGCKSTDKVDVGQDPALFDQELRDKLDANQNRGKARLEEVIRKYTDLQYTRGRDEEDNDVEEDTNEKSDGDKSEEEEVVTVTIEDLESDNDDILPRMIAPRKRRKSESMSRSPDVLPSSERSKSPNVSNSPIKDKSPILLGSPDRSKSSDRPTSPLRSRSPLVSRSPEKSYFPSMTRSAVASISPVSLDSPESPRSPVRTKSPIVSTSPDRLKSSAVSRSPGLSKSPSRSRSPVAPKSPMNSESHEVSRSADTLNSLVVSRSPNRSKSPVVSWSPDRSKSPGMSRSPVRSKSPVVSSSPNRLKSQGVSRSPERSRSPKESRSPLRSPSVLMSPVGSKSPGVSSSPAISPVVSTSQHSPAKSKSPLTSQSPVSAPEQILIDDDDEDVDDHDDSPIAKTPSVPQQPNSPQTIQPRYSAVSTSSPIEIEDSVLSDSDDDIMVTKAIINPSRQKANSNRSDGQSRIMKNSTDGRLSLSRNNSSGTGGRLGSEVTGMKTTNVWSSSGQSSSNGVKRLSLQKTVRNETVASGGRQFAPQVTSTPRQDAMPYRTNAELLRQKGWKDPKNSKRTWNSSQMDEGKWQSSNPNLFRQNQTSPIKRSVNQKQSGQAVWQSETSPQKVFNNFRQTGFGPVKFQNNPRQNFQTNTSVPNQSRRQSLYRPNVPTQVSGMRAMNTFVARGGRNSAPGQFSQNRMPLVQGKSPVKMANNRQMSNLPVQTQRQNNANSFNMNSQQSPLTQRQANVNRLSMNTQQSVNRQMQTNANRGNMNIQQSSNRQMQANVNRGNMNAQQFANRPRQANANTVRMNAQRPGNRNVQRQLMQNYSPSKQNMQQRSSNPQLSRQQQVSRQHSQLPNRQIHSQQNRTQRMVNNTFPSRSTSNQSFQSANQRSRTTNQTFSNTQVSSNRQTSSNQRLVSHANSSPVKTVSPSTRDNYMSPVKQAVEMSTECYIDVDEAEDEDDVYKEQVHDGYYEQGETSQDDRKQFQEAHDGDLKTPDDSYGEGHGGKDGGRWGQKDGDGMGDVEGGDEWEVNEVGKWTDDVGEGEDVVVLDSD